MYGEGEGCMVRVRGAWRGRGKGLRRDEGRGEAKVSEAPQHVITAYVIVRCRVTGRIDRGRKHWEERSLGWTGLDTRPTHSGTLQGGREGGREGA